MFGRLIKHEFHFTGRLALPLCGGMLVLAVLAGIMLRNWGWWERGLIGNAIIDLYYLSIFAVSIGVFIILMQHFKRNLFGDEGYLMRSLPVSVHELLLSKLLVAIVWYLVSGALIVLSVVLSGAVMGLDFRGLGDLLRAIELFIRRQPRFVAEAVLAMLGIMIFITLLFYACFTIAQNFSKRRVVYLFMCAVVFFVLLQFLSWFYVLMGAEAEAVLRGRRPLLYLAELYVSDAVLYFLTWGFLTYRPCLE